MRRGWTMMAVLALAAGCGGSGQDERVDRVLSCGYPVAHLCSQISGPLTDGEQDQLMKNCAATLGSFSTEACSTEGMLPGHCAYANVERQLVGADYYGADEWTDFTASARCAFDGGTWVE